MPPKIALAPGFANTLQLLSLDAYTGVPCVDSLDQLGNWIPAGPLANPRNLTGTILAAGPGYGGNLNAVFLGQSDHQPYLVWQDCATGAWSSPIDFITANHTAGYGAVALAAGNGNNLHVVLLGRDDSQPYLCWQDNATGIWSAPAPLTTSSHAAGFSTFALARGNAGNLQLVALGADDGQPYLYWQNNTTGAWSGPQLLVGPTPHPGGFTALALAPGNSGNLQLIALGAKDRQPYLYWQAAGNGIWSGPTPLAPVTHAAGFSLVAACPGNSTNLQVILLGADDHQPYLCWQASGNGIWSSLAPLFPVGKVQLPLSTAIVPALTNVRSGNTTSLNLQVIFQAAAGNTHHLAWQDASGNWNYYGGIFHPTWMQDLRNASPSFGNCPLNYLVIPGTHDSGTYGITPDSPASPDAPTVLTAIKEATNTPAAALLMLIPGIGAIAAAAIEIYAKTHIDEITAGWASAQGRTIAQQLRSGIRYLDLRVSRNNSGEFWIVHSKYSIPLSQVLDAVATFLTQQPEEIVLLDFNHFYNCVGYYPELVAAIEASLGPWMASKLQFSPSSPLNALWSTSARAIVFLHDSNSASYIEPDATWPRLWSNAPDTTISSIWPNTASLSALQSKLAGYIQDRPTTGFFILQGILTPDVTTIVEGVLPGGTQPSNLFSWAHTTSPAVVSWLPTWGGTLNIIILDHAEVVPSYIQTVVALNAASNFGSPPAAT